MAALSVLLLTRNGSRDLASLLPALYGQQGVGPFEVIAVDSGSTDATIETLSQYPVKLERISPETFHHARTRNFAAGLARGEILILLSQDAVPASDLWLKHMVANFNDPRVGAVYGRQLPKPGAPGERHETFETIYGPHKLVKDPAHRNGHGYRFYHFSNANAALRKSVWQATQFPEDLKVFEDMGIAKRILDGGWKIVYEPEAAVFHSHNHNAVGLFKRYFDIGCTLKRLNIWDAPGTKISIARDGWSMLKEKIRRNSAASDKRQAGKGIQLDIAKSAGLFLGLHQACLPVALKRRFSAFNIFG